MRTPKIIAVDCDDVLTDYNGAYGEVYGKCFGKEMKVVNPNAYHATEYWGIDWNGRDAEHQEFESHFAKYGWRNMKAIEGAVEATHILHEAGYKIFVVTRMPESGEKDRSANLKDLNFKFDSVIGTGHCSKTNPKKPYIEALKPEFFVDDCIFNFVGIEDVPTKFVWLKIARELKDNNKLLKKQHIHHTHPNLLDFVNTVIK